MSTGCRMMPASAIDQTAMQSIVPVVPLSVTRQNGVYEPAIMT